MPTLYLLGTGYLFILPWANAGLADDWSRDLCLFFSLFILAIFIFKDFRFIQSTFFSFLPLIAFICVFIISFSNPSFKKFHPKILEEINYKSKLENCGSLAKANLVSNGIRLIANTSSKDPSKGLTIFLDFKNRYKDRFGAHNKDSLWNMICELEDKLKIPNLSMLPSLPVRNINNITKVYFLCFHVFLGFIFYKLILEDKSRLDKTCFLIFINTSILAIVGIIQKMYYVPNNNVLEILGIWDAPEPRYFFSTFTYKNHWCTYAISSLFAGFLVCFKEFRNYNYDVIRSTKFMVCLLFSFPIFVSIPYAGSRSGSIILLSVVVYILIKFIIGIERYKKNKFCLFFIFILFLIIPFVSLNFLKSNEFIEMRKNSISQIENALNGKPPLRVSLWKDTVSQIREKVWFGHGYDGYKTTNPAHQSYEVRFERSRGLENAHNPYIPLVAHAHSDFLEWICNYGIIGFFLFILPFLFHQLSIALFYESISIKVLFVGSLIIYLMSMIDFPTRTPACLTILTVYIGMSFGYFRSNFEKRI